MSIPTTNTHTMKTHKYLLACFVTLGLTLSSVFSAAIFEETFENKAADTYLGNVATSDGNATWASSASTWQVEEVTNTNALGLGKSLGVSVSQCLKYSDDIHQSRQF